MKLLLNVALSCGNIHWHVLKYSTCNKSQGYISSLPTLHAQRGPKRHHCAILMFAILEAIVQRWQNKIAPSVMRRIKRRKETHLRLTTKLHAP